ncbi:hypothetical protein PFISCL1PPCAC_25490, partial [Pristionchus fissidentatus]
ETIHNGVKVTELMELLQLRVKSPEFFIDLFALFPTDIVLLYKTDLSLARFNRLLKCYRLIQFGTLTEMRATFPNLFRLLKLIFMCFIIFH